MPDLDLLTPVRYTFSRKEIICLEPGLLYRIEVGATRSLIWSALDDIPKSVGFWGPGDVVGWRGTHLKIYEMECLMDTQISPIPTRNWSEELPKLLEHLEQTEFLLQIMHHSRVRQRLHLFLGWLGRKFGQDQEQGRRINLRLSHQSLAESIGTTRVTVTRLLGQFREEGLIDYHHRQLTLLNSFPEE